MEERSENPDLERTPSLGRRLAEVALAFLPLGWIAFGGPQAHIALLQERFVARRRWLDEQRFVELLGLGQGLPGPTSTQMVVAVGTARAGPLGGLLAFLLFLYPAATIMALAGLGVAAFLDEGGRPQWLDGIQPATVALVAVAAWRLGVAVVNTRLTMGLMLLGAVVTILVRQPWAFPATLALGGLVTAVALRSQRHDAVERSGSIPLDNLGISRVAGALLLLVFFGLLGGLILARLALDWSWLQVLESFYRTGSLIFGGGQVVLPMLSAEVVEPLGNGAAVPGAGPDAGAARPAVQLQRLPGGGSRRRSRAAAGLCGPVSAGSADNLRSATLLGAGAALPLGKDSADGSQRHRHRSGGGRGVPAVGAGRPQRRRSGDCPAGLRVGDVFPSAGAAGDYRRRRAGLAFWLGGIVVNPACSVHTSARYRQTKASKERTALSTSGASGPPSNINCKAQTIAQGMKPTMPVTNTTAMALPVDSKSSA